MTEPVLEIVRMFDAPPQAVFEAWLEKDQWQAWIGPEGVHCDITLFEPRVGGRYHLTMNLADGRKLAVRGEFTIVERPHRFAMTWGADGGTLVSVSLRAVGARTEMTLRHEGFPKEEHASFMGGWNSALGKLARYVKGETP